jgi:hypothetical protein
MSKKFPLVPEALHVSAVIARDDQRQTLPFLPGGLSCRAGFVTIIG